MNEAPVYPISLDLDSCTHCLKCVDACPTGVFQAEGLPAKVVLAYPADCHVCFLCVNDCPTGAVRVSWDAPNPRRRSVYDDLGLDLDIGNF
jgi:NAD-dependent dihydropyrimidine dehydrogenase PreA subunit